MTQQRGQPSELKLASPAALCVLGFSAVNLAYTIIAAGFILRGETPLVVPPSIARRLIFDGADLTVPLVLVYNLALSLAPLTLFRTEGFRALTRETWGLVRDGFARADLWPVLLTALVMAGVYVAVQRDAILPFEDERVRWFTDQVPDATPVDQALLVRAHYLLSFVADVRYTVPLLNACFGALLAWGTAAYLGSGTAWASSLAVVAVMLSPGPVFYSTGADGELPAAIFGLLGVLAVARWRWTLGIFLLWVGLLFKSTAIYFVAVGVVQIVSNRRAWPEITRLLRSSTVWCMGAFAVFYYLNYSTYVIHRGGTYLVSGPAASFVIHPLLVFSRDFTAEYLPALLLAVGSWLLVPGDRRLRLGVPIALLLIRCTALPAGGYYTLIFLPVAAWLAAELFARLALARPSSVAIASLAVLLADSLTYNAVWFSAHRDAFVSGRTMNWDGVVRAIDASLSPGGEVFYRKVSPKYDLLKRGRGDARFTYVGENPVETERRLTARGSKVYLAPVSDLDPAARLRLVATGFRALLPDVGPPRSRFVLWFKQS